MEGEAGKFVNFISLILPCLCYCYFISSRIQIGKYRLFSLVPVFYLFATLPLSFTCAITTCLATFFCSLANFKLLLFAFDKGPLSPYPPKSLSLFIAIAILPVNFRLQKDVAPRKPKKLPLNLSMEILASLLAWSLLSYREKLHPVILLLLYCCVVFLNIDIMIHLSHAVVHLIGGPDAELKLEQPSYEPYLSTSLQQFWGKRWNLMVTSMLRYIVYEPVKTGSALIVGKKTSSLLAVFASFLVSGLLHELLFYLTSRVNPTWEMTAFFVLHGICVVMEIGVKRAVAGKWQLPTLVAWLLTMGFVLATSFWLFFPPLMKSGIDVRVIEEFKMFAVFIRTQLNLIDVERLKPGWNFKGAS